MIRVITITGAVWLVLAVAAGVPAPAAWLAAGLAGAITAARRWLVPPQFRAAAFERRRVRVFRGTALTSALSVAGYLAGAVMGVRFLLARAARPGTGRGLILSARLRAAHMIYSAADRQAQDHPDMVRMTIRPAPWLRGILPAALYQEEEENPWPEI